jgi:uncharacterized protein YndB with AHSA1/START domain
VTNGHDKRGQVMSIVWPERYAPDRVAARVSNEITISAPPAMVWAWLVRASLWPTWYPNSHQVQIAGGARDLSAGAGFKWRTFGVCVSSTVREFEPHSRIAWDAKGPFLDVYNAWLIEPRGGGSWVLTEENQNGLAARIQAAIMPRRMFKGHQLWPESLKARAEGGAPLTETAVVP